MPVSAPYSASLAQFLRELNYLCDMLMSGWVFGAGLGFKVDVCLLCSCVGVCLGGDRVEASNEGAIAQEAAGVPSCCLAQCLWCWWCSPRLSVL